MFDNTTYGGEAAYTFLQRTLDNCGEIRVTPLIGGPGGLAADVPIENDSLDPQPYHIGPRDKDYVRSSVQSEEYVLGEPPLLLTKELKLKRAGTYVYGTRLGRRESEAMTFTCIKTGQTADVNFKDVVLELRDARTARIVSTIVHQIGFDAAGRFVVTWKEFPAASTPAEKGYL